MNGKKEMKLLGETISISSDYIDIYDLKFLKDNPRVYACTHGELGFHEKMEEEQQEIIFRKLLQEPSVKNLIPEVIQHGGLIEPILIRHDTKEVIEGNSRLAVYRKLDQRKEKGEWGLIPCNIVSNLTDDQQAAFLNQIHVKGKTQWSAYEKANFAFVRKERGWPVSKIAELFGESESTIRDRVRTIEDMKNNEDTQRSHFSYYKVLRGPKIAPEIRKRSDLRDRVFEDIKNLGSDEEDNNFKAQELREKMPAITAKPKVLRKYIDRTVDLDEAYQSAKISHVEEKVKKAILLIGDVSCQDVSRLERNQLNAFKQVVKKLSREVGRIEKMVGKLSSNG